MVVFAAIGALALGLPPLADIRVGEDGDTARVVVVCSEECGAEPLGDDQFLITGVSANFSLDVSKQSNKLSSIQFAPHRDGAALSIKTQEPPRGLSASACGERTLCFDFDMRPMVKTPAPSSERVKNSVDRLSADLDALISRTRLTEAEPDQLVTATLSAKGCLEATEALAKDAWDLMAYRTVAICRAKAGDREEAIRYLARLDQFEQAHAASGSEQRKAGLAALR